MSTESSTNSPVRATPRGRLASVLAFLQRHHRFVTFVSAAAVLGAFLLKDVVREDTKELLDAIESAHRDLRVESQITLTNSRIRDAAEVQSRMGRGLFDVKDATLQADPKLAEDLLHIDIQSVQWQMEDIGLAINSLNALSEKFPKRPFASEQKSLEKLEEKMRKLASELYAFDQRIATLQENGEQLDWLKLKNEAQPILDTVNGEDGPNFQVAHLVNSFGTLLDQEGEKARRRYSAVTIASRVVYLLGFTTAFIAQIVGIKSVGGE